MMKAFLLFAVTSTASAILSHNVVGKSCLAEDLQHRVQFQNKLASICEDMCKEINAYPKCAQCPDFVAPDSTPGVMTWSELLEHMDNLVAWGNDQLKSWHKQAAALQKSQHVVLSALGEVATEKSCSATDLKLRAVIQNKMASICEDMCKEINAYPKCAQCPDFVEPDSTPGVMTWKELLEHMDNLVAWGNDQIKGWHKQAAALQKNKHATMSTVQAKSTVAEKACISADLQHRLQFQNKLASICEDMCKEINAYPKCAQCPDFVAPDSTPGVMTWVELLEHMDNLVAWGNDQLKSWHQQASALQITRATGLSCEASDSMIRARIQNKMASICEDMCKEINAYPKCAQCPDFVAPDSTPGVVTWPELLEHMDNLVAWGNAQLKGWHQQASALQEAQRPKLAAVQAKSSVSGQACASADAKNRVQFQNKLAAICEDMCKEINAYPKCAQCPDFVAPDSTPGVMTWDELLEHMDNLVAWGNDQLKGWHKQAAALQIVKKNAVSAESCEASDAKHRALIQNKMASICEDMCKEINAYPKCAQCPDFVAPDSTPGVMTWPELLEHMDNLVAWGQDQLKSWGKQAAAALQLHSK